MRLGAVIREVLGLFVDDGSLAVAILVWVGAMGLLTLGLGIGGSWVGLLLFAGLAAILIENVYRRAGRK